MIVSDPLIWIISADADVEMISNPAVTVLNRDHTFIKTPFDY